MYKHAKRRGFRDRAKKSSSELIAEASEYLKGTSLPRGVSKSPDLDIENKPTLNAGMIVRRRRGGSGKVTMISAAKPELATSSAKALERVRGETGSNAQQTRRIRKIGRKRAKARKGRHRKAVNVEGQNRAL